MLSRGGRFHAILATSSIPEAVSYYRRLKVRAPELRCTALFDPSIDNDGGAVVKEDALAEIISDYNAAYGKEFTIPTWDAMKKDISARLAHKKPYLNIDGKREERLDILIVVNQMLTGFDSKWVNTLYLDKVIDYADVIQAFSRTNRLFGPEKPFGVIRYYRRPHTMRGYIEAAVKLYSGDKPLDLFVQKLPQNIQMMDARLVEIKALFAANDVADMSSLPESREARAKFAKDFVELSRFLEAAQVQGFSWERDEYEFSAGAVDEELLSGVAADDRDVLVVRPEIDERTYLILAQRYKELFSKGPGTGSVDVPYDIDGHLTEIDTGKIDTDYMNANFVKWLKALHDEDSDVRAASEELHRSFASLPADEQRLAEMFLHDVERGEACLEEGKTLRDYITAYGRREKDGQFDALVAALGVDRDLLVEMTGLNLTEANLNEYGRFARLVGSVDKALAKAYFDGVEGAPVAPFKVNVKATELLRRFVLEGGFEL